MTIRNAGIEPIIDEFAEAFARRLIYLVRDSYSGYDQFQLAVESRDITMMWTLLGVGRPLVRKRSYNNLFRRKNLRMGDMRERNTHRERERERHKEVYLY